MKKRTYKSASASPKTSSQSGTSAKTVATGSQPSKFGFILDRVREKTPEQVRAALTRLGIVTPEGTLTTHYKAKKPKPKKRA